MKQRHNSGGWAGRRRREIQPARDAPPRIRPRNQAAARWALYRIATDGIGNLSGAAAPLLRRRKYRGPCSPRPPIPKLPGQRYRTSAGAAR